MLKCTCKLGQNVLAKNVTWSYNTVLPGALNYKTLPMKSFPGNKTHAYSVPSPPFSTNLFPSNTNHH